MRSLRAPTTTERTDAHGTDHRDPDRRHALNRGAENGTDAGGLDAGNPCSVSGQRARWRAEQRADDAADPAAVVALAGRRRIPGCICLGCHALDVDEFARRLAAADDRANRALPLSGAAGRGDAQRRGDPAGHRGQGLGRSVGHGQPPGDARSLRQRPAYQLGDVGPLELGGRAQHLELAAPRLTFRAALARKLSPLGAHGERCLICFAEAAALAALEIALAALGWRRAHWRARHARRDALDLVWRCYVCDAPAWGRWPGAGNLLPVEAVVGDPCPPPKGISKAFFCRPCAADVRAELAAVCS